MNDNYSNMPVQTRSQTRQCQTATPTATPTANPTAEIPGAIRVKKINETIKLQSIDELTKYRSMYSKIMNFIHECDSAKSKCERKRISLDLYSYLVIDENIWFLHRYNIFTHVLLQRLLEFKTQQSFYGWEADYFIDKIVTTDDIRVLWDAICKNVPVVFV